MMITAIAIHHTHLKPNRPNRLLVLALLTVVPPSCTMAHYIVCPTGNIGIDIRPYGHSRKIPLALPSARSYNND